MSHANVDANQDATGLTVLSLLRRQKELYAGLSKLAQRQRSLIASNDNTGLIALLSDRKRMTDSLVEVGRQITPPRKDWPAALSRLPVDLRKEADTLLVEVGMILKQIKEFDDQDARVLSTRKARVAENLKGVQTQQRAVSAYASSAKPAAGNINRLDEAS